METVVLRGRIKDLMNCSLVCSDWHRACMQASVWEWIFKKRWRSHYLSVKEKLVETKNQQKSTPIPRRGRKPVRGRRRGRIPRLKKELPENVEVWMKACKERVEKNLKWGKRKMHDCYWGPWLPCSFQVPSLFNPLAPPPPTNLILDFGVWGINGIGWTTQLCLDIHRDPIRQESSL
jgi:hypothetical protein